MRHNGTSRRVKYFKASSELIFTMLCVETVDKSERGAIEITRNALPQDVRLIWTYIDNDSGNIVFLVESSEFPEVENGDYIEELPRMQYAEHFHQEDMLENIKRRRESLDRKIAECEEVAPS